MVVLGGEASRRHPGISVVRLLPGWGFGGYFGCMFRIPQANTEPH